MAVAQRVLEVSQRIALEHGRAHVASVRLSVGAFAHLDADALRFAFGALAGEGPAAGAELVIEQGLAQGLCGDCGRLVEARGPTESCPDCNGRALSWDGSLETEVVSVTLNVEERR